MSAIKASKCGKCGEEADIAVIVCRHVLKGDFDVNDDGDEIPAIHMTVRGSLDPVAHACDIPACPETDLCSDCWTDL